jgi:CMP-N-acetylneuraminic acid synthetase
VVDFLGKPIIAYTIEAALGTGLFARTVVSTDDDEIARTAAQYSAEVEERPADLATDTAKLTQVMEAFLESEEQAGREYDELFVLLATAPLRRAEDIQGVQEMLEPGICDFVMAVTHYDRSPHKALVRGEGETLGPMWPDLILKRAQELPKFFADNGSTYGLNVEAFRREKTFYGSSLLGYLMPAERSVDIDDMSDLELAKLFARQTGIE